VRGGGGGAVSSVNVVHGICTQFELPNLHTAVYRILSIYDSTSVAKFIVPMDKVDYGIRSS
jgi:hypothetical protein